jgi:hypothetical protein
MANNQQLLSHQLSEWLILVELSMVTSRVEDETLLKYDLHEVQAYE